MGATLLIRLFFRQVLLHFLQNSKAHPNLGFMVYNKLPTTCSSSPCIKEFLEQ
jgi:hypothetical protein